MSNIKTSLQEQINAAKKGFEWAHNDHALDKIFEEIDELKAAYHSGDIADIQDELGDCMYALISLARVMNIDPDQALLEANNKFKKRFQAIEKLSEKPLINLSHQEWKTLWQEAKTRC